MGRINRGSHIYSLMFFIAYAFKGQVHVFAGRVKIVSHSSCRTSSILKYFCPLVSSALDLYWIGSCFLGCLPDPLPDPWERSGSVVECLTRDRGGRGFESPASLCCGP